MLGILGSKSGRDMDKMKESGLTPSVALESVTFAEAEITLVLKQAKEDDSFDVDEVFAELE